jgi:putative transposase
MKHTSCSMANGYISYRAVDSQVDTIDFLLRSRRDGAAALAFFKKAFKNNSLPDKVTIDKSGSNKWALEYRNNEAFRPRIIEIRQVKYLNNIIEQDRRFIKKRIRPMQGFKNFHSTQSTMAGIRSIRMIQKGQI